MKGPLEQLMRAEGMEKCGSCLYFKEIEKIVKRVYAGRKDYIVKEVMKGKCVNKVYLEENPSELIVTEDDVVCALYKEKELNLKG